MCNMKQGCKGQFRLVDIEVILILTCSRHQPLSHCGRQGCPFPLEGAGATMQRKTLSKQADPIAQGGQHRLGDAMMKDSSSSRNILTLNSMN